jgi:hypothetical protein
MKAKFGIYTRFQFVLLALFSPKRLVTAITSGFLSAVDSMGDDELKALVQELNDAN